MVVNRRQFCVGAFGSAVWPSSVLSTPYDWVSEELTNRQMLDKPTIIVDDVNGKVDLRLPSIPENISFPVITGENTGDDLRSDLSVFSQKITPSGVFSQIRVIYDPNLDDRYHRKVVIAFTPDLPVNGRVEVLGFHSVLDLDNDRDVLISGKGNHRLSNGCIRLLEDDFDKMLQVVLGERIEFLETAPKRGHDSPIEMPIDVNVVILPENQRGRDSVIRLFENAEGKDTRSSAKRGWFSFLFQ